MRNVLPAIFLFVSCQSAPAPTPPSGPTSTPAAPAPAGPPSRAPPPEPSGIIDEGALDRSVNPCDDFYKFACGGWMAKTPIPPDRAQWVRSFSEIQERNETVLRQILDDEAAGKAGADDPYAKKLGDLYASCMDEAGAETAGMATLNKALASIEAISTDKALGRGVAAMHLSGAGALFGFTSRQDDKDATQVIGVAAAGGLGLPDRDYYMRDDAKSIEIRAKHTEHLARMLEPPRAAPKAASAQAQTILEMENALAKVTLQRAQRPEPYKVYHRPERAGLGAKAPRFAWDDYFEALG